MISRWSGMSPSDPIRIKALSVPEKSNVRCTSGPQIIVPQQTWACVPYGHLPREPMLDNRARYVEPASR